MAFVAIAMCESIEGHAGCSWLGKCYLLVDAFEQDTRQNGQWQLKITAGRQTLKYTVIWTKCLAWIIFWIKWSILLFFNLSLRSEDKLLHLMSSINSVNTGPFVIALTASVKDRCMIFTSVFICCLFERMTNKVLDWFGLYFKSR